MIKTAESPELWYFQRFFTNVHQKCLFCFKNTLTKNGRKNGRQRYKCSHCNKYLPLSKRPDNDELLHQYIHHKQTCAQLAQQHQCSIKTIQRRLKKGRLKQTQAPKPVANIIMDTTYFGRAFGVMVFMNSLDGSIVHTQYVTYETAALYHQGLLAVIDKGMDIQSITADGFKGIAALFPDIPFQMCQFHQQQTIRRYLTRRPKSEAGKTLKQIADGIFETDGQTFGNALRQWFEQHKSYLNELSYSEDGKRKWYTHKRLRSAYHSLKRNLPYLFTFEQNRELMMPNTTNRLEGKFGELKNKIRCHAGMSMETKRLFIDNFFGV
ncbi:Transposase and inactivated derivatives [Bergeriella denitrificans]|uniref:Transposase and inactivated derivatives n=1 Tax=Bergeriella denitrificans TaxID=494 RepID=A0A378ULG8_BERDE|nr:hypothetical protein [Bergeriella denitrificans]STZ77331.1 Transposase and inactivated derivatives [Bergeriella denitrificans]